MSTITTQVPAETERPAPEDDARPVPGSARRRRPHPGPRLRRALLGSVPIILFALVWEFAPLLGSQTFQVFLPRFHVVVAAWWNLLVTGELWSHFSASLLRSVVGFAIATVLGIAFGLVIGWYRTAHEMLNPLLEIFRNTAALALLPVFVLLLGIGELSKVVIVIYAAFFPVLLNTAAGLKTVDPLLIRFGKTLGLRQAALFRHIILPAAVPTIFTGIRIAGSAAILVLIAAEMVGAKSGLGFLITSSQNSFLIPQMYAGVLTIALLGLIVNSLLVALESRFSRWRTDQ